VNYEAAEAAQKAVAELHGKDLRTDAQKEETKEDAEPESYLAYVGRAQTKVERAREFREKAKAGPAKEGRAAGVNLYIKNLDEGENNNTLKELFAPFGSITSCIAMMDEKDICKGFGFVCFNSPDEATKAVTEMHLKVVKGKPLYVGLAEKKDVRQDRLRQRYSPGGGCGGGGGMDGGMGKGGKDGMGMGGMGGMGTGGLRMGTGGFCMGTGGF